MTTNLKCPCGGDYAEQSLSYSECCEPFISGSAKPEHCEQLMRSRYTAYSLAKVDYLIATWHSSKQADLNRQELVQSAETTKWLRLEVVKSHQQGNSGVVEFNAWFKDSDGQGQKSEINCLHETSRFEKVGEQWYYLDGDVESPGLSSSGLSKVGRNDPCPCGSGKKYKKCCG